MYLYAEKLPQNFVVGQYVYSSDIRFSREAWRGHKNETFFNLGLKIGL